MLSKKHVALCILLAGTVSAPLLSAQATKPKPKPAPAAPTHFMVGPQEAKWTAPPEGMIRGTPSVTVTGGTLRYALISGDPMKPGAPFTVRLACSDGFKAAPHWHPTDENLVVLSGTFAVGTGDTFDPAAMQDMPTGGYTFMPRRMHHFGLCKGATDVLIYGLGPFQINYLAAAGAGTSPVAKQD
jgi:hypothetical protein